MTYSEAYDATLTHLREQEKATNSALLDLIGGDEKRYRRIREELILGDLAEDYKGVGLKYIGPSVRDEPEVDLFVSYAHKDDDEYGTVRALVERFQALQLELYDPRPPVVFYDRRDIRGFDDWEHRILAKLREAKAMLVVLSPAYFASDYCRKEWEVFLERERKLAHSHGAIVNLYAVEIPGFTFDPGQVEDTWMKDLARRQWRIEAKNLWHLGPALFEHDDAPAFIEKIRQDLTALVEHGSRVLTSRSTVPPPSKNFVGRSVEMAALRTRLLDGRVGSIVAAQGLGGMGKSALAFAYAQHYAADYPGGRYLVRAEGQSDLVTALLTLAPTLGVELSSEEARKPGVASAKVHAALTAKGPALLVLDNVSDPDLLAPHQTARALPPQGVHVLATSRLSPDALHLGEEACQEVGPLPESDALRLFDRYRPFASEPDPEAAEAAARDLVRWLGGYALALETVAVYLWQHRSEGVSYEDYRDRLEREGFAGLEGTGADRAVSLSLHDETQLSRLLGPTLDMLSEAERAVLRFAAVLPPDAVVWPWLRTLVGQVHPGIVPEAKPGYPDPWRSIQDRLHGLRLLTPTEDIRVSQMHRLVQSVVQARTGLKAVQVREEMLYTAARERAKYLKQEGWTSPSTRWELVPLKTLATWGLEQGDVRAADLAGWLAAPLRELGHFADTKQLMLRAIQVEEQNSPLDARHSASSYAALALVDRELGNFEAARDLLRRSIAIEERASDPNRHSLATSYANLAVIEQDLSNLKEALRFMQKALEASQQAYPAGHPELATYYSNLALLQRDLGDLEPARFLLRQAVEIWENAYPADHPVLAIGYSNLATVEAGLQNLTAARTLYKRAIEIDLKAHTDEHPNLLLRYSNLATVEQRLGNLEAARALLRQAVETGEKIYPADHPQLGIYYSNLASVEAGLGDLEAAVALQSKSLKIDTQSYPEDHPNLAVGYSNLASYLWDLGVHDSARDFQRLAFTMLVQKLGPEHPHVRGVWKWLVENDSDWVRALRKGQN